METDALVAG